MSSSSASLWLQKFFLMYSHTTGCCAGGTRSCSASHARRSASRCPFAFPTLSRSNYSASSENTLAASAIRCTAADPAAAAGAAIGSL